ncbi:hypothetical protein DRQ21_02360 [Candidatus Fermentibacteria bacterium]|nr:MAG: hypothetical protein DRQ21_02360 [Candidatus Fermentibacteria bacterium]
MTHPILTGSAPDDESVVLKLRETLVIVLPDQSARELKSNGSSLSQSEVTSPIFTEPTCDYTV